MLKINKSTLIVFDLDDTLYKEKEYHFSGLAHLKSIINFLYKKDISPLIERHKISPSDDILSEIACSLNLPESFKDTLLWLYRLHKPDISLSNQVRQVISNLDKESFGVCIITDGRAVSQRLKIEALGLSRIPVYISEEWGSTKPHDLRFKQVMEDFSAEKFIYIGDNPRKDFLAPNKLGWTSIFIQGDEENIHSQSFTDLDDQYLPQITIKDLTELERYIC